MQQRGGVEERGKRKGVVGRERRDGDSLGRSNIRGGCGAGVCSFIVGLLSSIKSAKRVWMMRHIMHCISAIYFNFH